MMSAAYPGLEITFGLALYTIVEIILYLIHISVIVVLIAGRRKLFKNPFYTTVIIICLEDVVHYLICTMFGLRMSQMGFFTQMYLGSQWIGSAGSTISRTIMYSQLFGHVVISFNRFTIFWAPTQYEKLWRYPWYFFFIFIMPVLCVIYGIDDPGKVEYRDGIIITSYRYIKNLEISDTISLFVYIGNTAAAFLLSMLALYKYKRMKRTEQLSSIKIQDRRLLIYSFVIVGYQCLKLFYRMCRAMLLSGVSSSSSHMFVAVMYFLPMIYLAHALICSLSVIIISESSRQAYITFYYGLWLRIIYCGDASKYPRDLILPSTSVIRVSHVFTSSPTKIHCVSTV